MSKKPKKAVGSWREAARALERAFPETYGRKPSVVDLTSDGPSIVYSYCVATDPVGGETPNIAESAAP